ncbi:hypothetical protein [Microbacterium aureliae]
MSITTREPLDYGPGTPTPAPEWAITADPGAKPLLKAFYAARDAAKAAREAANTATYAFRDASVSADSGYVARRDVDIESWRRLDYEVKDARAAEVKIGHEVRRTYRALAAFVEASAACDAEALKVAEERHAAVVAKLAELDKAIVTFAEAEALVPDVYARKDGIFRHTVSGDVDTLARDLRGVIEREATR